MTTVRQLRGPIDLTETAYLQPKREPGDPIPCCPICNRSLRRVLIENAEPVVLGYWPKTWACDQHGLGLVPVWVYPESDEG